MSNKLLIATKNKIRSDQEKILKSNDITNIIIGIHKTENKNNDVIPRTERIIKEHETDLKKYWSSRTNEPYKIIFKGKNFVKNYEKQEDFVVHKVTEKDKEGIDEEYDNKLNDIDNHNKELNTTYTIEKKQDNYNKFMYNNNYKYKPIEEVPSDFMAMKENTENNKTENVNMEEIIQFANKIINVDENLQTNTPNKIKTTQDICQVKVSSRK